MTRGNTPHEAWASFLPDYVVQALSGGRSPLAHEHRFDAVALFADISGFTPMSEALGRAGKRGTEELTSILNSYFEPTIDIIHSFGGTVGKFAGDAMLVLFPYRGSGEVGAARRAAQCALDMQAGMHRYKDIETSGGVYTLTAKAGLALGQVLSATVGKLDIQLEHVLLGPLLDLCAEAEHHARPGEVVVHEGVLEALGDVVIAERRGEFLCVAELSRRGRRSARGASRPISAELGVSISRYVHPSIAARIGAGQSGLINEHRRVTILFGSFDDLDYDANPSAVSELRSYIAQVISVIDRFGGCLRQVDMGDKGSKYIAVFGAPISHEDDEVRAVRCALELHDLPGLDSSIGVNTGRVYCGLVGSEARREYAVIGDAVNVSARLMQVAKRGQTLVARETQSQAAEAFAWKRLDSLTLKGKSEPVPVLQPLAVQERTVVHLHEPAYSLPMIGRVTELNGAQALVDRACAGRGQILGLTGEAGIGKSRFAAELARLAVEREFNVYSGACESYATTTSYLVWRDIWRRLLGVDSAHSPAQQAGHLERLLESIEPGLGERGPLLGAVLNVPLPENELTSSLDPELKTESLKDLLLTCLRDRARRGPILIVLEDCHWIDVLSQELLELIGRNIAGLPILLAVLYRTADRGHGPIGWAIGRSNCTETRLEELSPEEVSGLIRLKLERLFDEGEPPASLVDQVTEHSGGNPFYIEELLNFMRDRGVDPRDPRSLEHLDLPDSLQSLIMARIDTLEDAERATLKVASVLGRQFKAAWLWGSYPQIGEPAEVKRQLGVLSALDLTPLDKPEPDLEYIFKHITTQEVAYGSLAFETRETLHESVGAFIEHSYGQELDQHLDVLAHHYGRSRNTDKQRTYFHRAADAATATYANEAAIDYYRRLMPLLDGAERGDVVRRLGEVLQLVGDWAGADEMYRQALVDAEAASAERARAMCWASIGSLCANTQSYDAAVSWLEQARAEFDLLGDSAELSRVLDRLSFTYFQRSDYVRALECALEHLRLSEELDDTLNRSAAEGNLGLVHWHRGDHELAAKHLERSLRLAGKVDFKRGLIHAANDLAGVHVDRGDYASAVKIMDEGFQVASEIGYRHAAGVIVANAGELCRLQGDYGGAIARYRHALQISTQLGDRTGVLHMLGSIGVVCAEKGRYEQADHLLSRAIDVAREMNERWLLCESLFHRAQLLDRIGRTAEAEQTCREALTIAEAIGQREVRLRARLLATGLEMKSGRLDTHEASAALETLLNEDLKEPERAAVHFDLWLLDGEREASRQLASGLYRSLYSSTPNAEYRRRYERLTRKRLPAPPVLPPVESSIEGQAASIDALMEQAELLAAEAT